MSNELRILPLRKYEVRYLVYSGHEPVEKKDVFTADFHNVEEGRTKFYRTGNVIREYHNPLNRIVVTPVDDDSDVSK